MGKIDPVGKWFGILEELGEMAQVILGKITSPDGEPEWIFLSHERYDGVGAMAHVLRESGYRLNRLPELKNPRPPRFFGKARAYYQGLRVSGFRYMPWKKYNPEETPRFLGIAWHRFSAEESRHLSEKCKALGISLNTLLLWHLDQALLPLFKTRDFTRQWMIPINMRGGVKRPKDTDNHSTYLGISIPPSQSIVELHANIREELAKNQHWGNWYLMLSVGRMGIDSMRKILRNYRRKGHNWVGAFTNIGSWPEDWIAPEDSQSDPADWLICASVTQGHPLTAGCLTWRGRIGITLNFHASLLMDRKELQPLFESWKNGVLAFISPTAK